MLVLVPPDPAPGLSAEAGAALALGVLLDAVEALAGPGVDLGVLIAGPVAAPLVEAVLPPGVPALARPPSEGDAEVVRLGAPSPADLASALDREGAPSRSPRAWTSRTGCRSWHTRGESAKGAGTGFAMIRGSRFRRPEPRERVLVPIYEYRCTDCGHQFEVNQRMSDDPLTECPVCQGAIQKVLFAPAIHFKGTGFHNTDYGTRKRPPGGDGGGESGSSDGAKGAGEGKAATKEPAASSSGKTVGLDRV